MENLANLLFCIFFSSLVSAFVSECCFYGRFEENRTILAKKIYSFSVIGSNPAELWLSKFLDYCELKDKSVLNLNLDVLSLKTRFIARGSDFVSLLISSYCISSMFSLFKLFSLISNVYLFSSLIFWILNSYARIYLNLYIV